MPDDAVFATANRWGTAYVKDERIRGGRVIEEICGRFFERTLLIRSEFAQFATRTLGEREIISRQSLLPLRGAVREDTSCS